MPHRVSSQMSVFIVGRCYSDGHSVVPVASIVPFARYSASDIVWHRWKQPLTAVCGVVPVAAIVPVFPSIVYIPALLRDHCCLSIM